MIFDNLVGAVALDPIQTQIVEGLANEAVMRFDSDAAAIRYFTSELRQRHPGIWLAINEMAELTALEHRARAN
jgi:hypothetical protein